MAEVINLHSDEMLAKAWEAHRVLAAKLLDNPKLLLDQPFMQELKRAERKWTRLFNMQDGL